jgi:aspartyl-tRNA(Asn)/glutamyl-tRNA(Gln) amidotransferase subunit A
VEAVEAALARIEERRELNAFMAVCAERARSEAKAAEAAVMNGEPLGALHGMPFSVKDLTNTEGVAHHAGLGPVRRTRAEGRCRRGGPGTGCGRDPDRQDDDAGIRAQAFHRRPVLRTHAQPLEPRHTLRRLERRRGGRGRGGHGAAGARLRWRRLDPHSGLLLRRRRPQGDAGRDPNLQAPDLFGANSYVGPMARDVADTRLMFDAIAAATARSTCTRPPSPRRAASPSCRRCSSASTCWCRPRCRRRRCPSTWT